MNQHKDLPSGSQAWAKEVDRLMEENKHLKEVVQRLCANAGLDYSNPQRGISKLSVPATENPVRQKLSSLADVKTYNVADGQVLTWDQQGQKWLPATPVIPTTGAGPVDISAVSYSGLSEGYGTVTSSNEFTYNAAGVIPNASGPDTYNIENWTTGTQYIGAGPWESVGMALITLDLDGFNRPVISLTCEDYADGSSSYFNMFSYGMRINTPRIRGSICFTAGRPTGLTTSSDDTGSQVYDLDLKKPIWWNGTAWTDALGTAV